MRPIGRKPRGGGGIYVLVVVVAAVLAWMFQDRWMARKRREARSEQGVVMAPNGFADKAAHWMLRRRGLEKAEEGGGTGAGSGAGEMGPKTITCWACEGTGKAYGEGGKAVPCGVCQGVGERVVRPFDAADRICSACSGMGRVEEEGGGAKECPACGGRGYVRGAE